MFFGLHKHKAFVAAALGLVTACGRSGVGEEHVHSQQRLASPQSAAPAPTDQTAQSSLGDVTVEPLTEGVWVHVSKDVNGIPANGLIVSTGSGSTLVDTTWSNEGARSVLAWAVSHDLPVQHAVLTHAHADRVGGLQAVLRHGVTVHTSRQVAQRLPAAAREAVKTFELPAGQHKDLQLGFEVFYPGAGHSPDNLVVWFPTEKVLFGGCLVKAADAPSLGSTADADMTHWVAAVTSVQERYKPVSWIVPGHGAWHGSSALSHTIQLIDTFKESQAKSATKQ